MNPETHRATEFFLLPWFVLGLVVIASLLVGQAVTLLDDWLFLAAMILVGIPHLAADPLIPQWARGRGFILGEWAGFGLLYLIPIAGVLGLWLLSPMWSLSLFIGLTIFHWGTGDTARFAASPRDAVALGLARGGLVIHAPVAFYPSSVATGLSSLPLADTMIPLQLWFSQSALILVACLILEVMVSLFPSRPLDSDRLPILRLHLVETPLLLALFWSAPPLLSLTTYFVAFHAWRHLLRLTGLRAVVRRESEPGVWESLLTFHLSTLFFTLVGIVIAVGVFLMLAFREAPAEAYAAVFVATMTLVTPAHVILCAWLDHVERGPTPTASSDYSGSDLPGIQRGLLSVLKDIKR